MRSHQPLSADVRCQNSTELEEVVDKGRSTGRRTTWAESPAKVWREKVSEQIEAKVIVLSARVQIQMNRQKTAVGDLHPGACCFHWARDDDETGLEGRRQRTVEPPCLRRCYRRKPCHRLSERDGDDIARAERRLRLPTGSHNFLLMYVLSLSRYRLLLRLSHSAVAVVLEVLPW